MASTAGRKRAPLPDGLEVGLRGMGFRQMTNTPESLPAQFRHPLFPGLFCSASAPRTPGSDKVAARYGDESRGLIRQGLVNVDALLRQMQGMVDVRA